MYGARLFFSGAIAALAAASWSWAAGPDPLVGVGLTVLGVVLALLAGLVTFTGDGTGTWLDGYDVGPDEPAPTPVESNDHAAIVPSVTTSSVWPFAAAVSLTIALLGATFDLFLVFLGSALLAACIVGWASENAERAGRRRDVPRPASVVELPGYRWMAHLVRFLVVGLGAVISASGLISGSMSILLGLGILATGIGANSWMVWLLSPGAGADARH